jgi:hypothetical protein
MIERVHLKELWISDRNFATRDFMLGILQRGGFFLMRQHGSLKYWTNEGEEKSVGTTESGVVYQQNKSVRYSQTDKKLLMRRMAKT